MASINDWKDITQKRIDDLKNDYNSEEVDKLFNELKAMKAITSDMIKYRKIDTMSKEELQKMYKDVLTYSISKACEEYQEELENANDPQVILSSMNKITDIQDHIERIDELNLKESELKELLFSVLLSVETKEYLNGKEIYDTAIEIRRLTEEEDNSNNKGFYDDLNQTVEEPKEPSPKLDDETIQNKDYYDVLEQAIRHVKDTDLYNDIVALRQQQETDIDKLSVDERVIKEKYEVLNKELEDNKFNNMSDNDIKTLGKLVDDFSKDPEGVVKELESKYNVNLGLFKKTKAKQHIDKISSFIEKINDKKKLDEKIQTLPDVSELSKKQIKERNEKSLPLYEMIKQTLESNGFGDEEFIELIKIDDGDYLDKLSSIELKNKSRYKENENTYEPLGDDSYTDTTENIKSGFGK